MKVICEKIEFLLLSIHFSHPDVKIWRRFFRNTPLVNRGIYIEMGALDGLTFSNTFIFEYCFGWTGVLIEGNPHNFLRLLENRPCNSNVWAVACPSSQSHAFMEGKLGTSKLADKNSTYVPHKMTMVPCRTLASVFNDNDIVHVDFFSLDVEGAELKVLETIDFDKVSIHVLIVEKNGLRKQQLARDIERSQAIDDLMAKAGMVKVPNDGTQILECQRRRKGMTVSQFNLYSSDIFVHPSLRDDIC